MSKIIAVFNIKGGVGKTTSSVNLAATAASMGFKTLLWDLDPQGATSFYLRVKNKIRGGASALAKGKHPASEQIKSSDYENLDVLPADISYRFMDEQIRKAKQQSSRFIRTLLKPVLADYDLIFVDCPPHLSDTVSGVLKISDLVLAPTIPTVLSLRTVKQLQSFIKKELECEVNLKIFFSQADLRRTMHKQLVDSFRLKKDELAAKTLIPASSDVEKMGLERAPFIHLEPQHKITELYAELWEELREGLGLETPDIIHLG